MGACCEEECEGGTITLILPTKSNSPRLPASPHPRTRTQGQDPESSSRDLVEKKHVRCVIMAIETPDLIHKRLHRRKPLRRSTEHILRFLRLFTISFDSIQYSIIPKARLHGDALDRFSSKHGNWCLELPPLAGKMGGVLQDNTGAV